MAEELSYVPPEERKMGPPSDPVSADQVNRFAEQVNEVLGDFVKRRHIRPDQMDVAGGFKEIVRSQGDADSLARAFFQTLKAQVYRACGTGFFSSFDVYNHPQLGREYLSSEYTAAIGTQTALRALTKLSKVIYGGEEAILEDRSEEEEKIIEKWRTAIPGVLLQLHSDKKGNLTLANFVEQYVERNTRGGQSEKVNFFKPVEN
jgi:hypothetical protein